MALKPQAQKGPYELMDNQFLKLAQSAQIIFKFKIIKKKKKKKGPYYKLYIQFITNLFLPLSLSVFIFNTANYSWSPV